MTLIDIDVRRLTEPDWYACGFCGAIRTTHTGLPPQRHADDCLWLALPRIVAVLEVAERLIAPHPEPTDEEMFLGVPAASIRVVDTEAYDALVRALRGDA